MLAVQPTAPATAPSAPNLVRNASLAGFARHLARRVADAADADQFAIALVGVTGSGDPDFEEPVPRQLLEALNDGRPARYRITLVLQAHGRDLGILRLGTVRPGGFTDEDVQAARQAADGAAVALARRFEQTSLVDDGRDAGPPPALVAFDPDCRIRLFTHRAEELFGWLAEEVIGARCQPVFACTDEDGRLLCGRCGLDATLLGSDHVWLGKIGMGTRGGERVQVDVSYWHLPTTGGGDRSRVLASVRERKEETGEVSLQPTPPRREGKEALSVATR
jgi:PAS domain-containing protein